MERSLFVPAPIAPLLAVASVGRSPVRARQLRWVAGELGRYGAGLPPGQRPRGTSGWLGPATVRGYLAAADAGRLRSRSPAGGPAGPQPARPSSASSARVRRSCLSLLADAAGLPDPSGPRLPDPARLPGPHHISLRLALAHLDALAEADTSGASARAAALLTLGVHHRLRTGELAAMRVDDLDQASSPAELTLRVTDRPPAARNAFPARLLSLDAQQRNAVRRWLIWRAELTGSTPREGALWVSLAGNHDGAGRRRPAGLAVHPNGLRRSVARTVAALNEQLAGAPGYRPLPTRLSQLRARPELALEAPVELG